MGRGMTYFFICANSFAAPFFSDSSESFIEADTVEAALEKFAANYKHPCGLFAAVAYEDANAYHKGAKPLAKWLSNHEIARIEITKGLCGYSYCGNGPGDFTVNGKRHVVENPKTGRIIQTAEAA